MENISSDFKFLSWSADEAKNFGLKPQMNRHRVHELPWFSDQELIKLVKNYPRTKMRVFTSGTEPEKRAEDWQPVDTEGASAEEILESVRVGRMWVNLQRIDAADARFRELGDRLYGEIVERCPHFKPLWTNRAFLFISSPNAMVYLHADYQPNMLWHIRGHKRIWIYPAYDERIVSLRRIEEICAGGEDDIDFRSEFDRIGQCFSVGPGDTVSWPARAPHRVVNGSDLNVSLSTFHETVDDYARVTQHCADYFMRETFPLAARLSNGNLASVKTLIFKVFRRAGYSKSRPVKEFYAKYRIDPDSPLGIRSIPNGPILTEHSRLVKAAASR
jgi:hypothetical protein